MLLNFSSWKKLYEAETGEKTDSAVSFSATNKQEAQQIAATKGDEIFGKGNYLVFDDDFGSFIFDKNTYESAKKSNVIFVQASSENPRFDPDFVGPDGKTKGRFVKTNLQTGKTVPIVNGQDLINSIGKEHFLDLDGLLKVNRFGSNTYSSVMGRRNYAAQSFLDSKDPTVTKIEEPIGKWGDLCKFLVRGSEYFQKGFPGVGKPCLEPWSEIWGKVPADKKFAVYVA